MAKPQTAHLVVFEDRTVVRKLAMGPEQDPQTGQWTAPVIPPGAVQVTPERYFEVGLGWTRINGTWAPPTDPPPARMVERLTLMETRLRALHARVTALERR